MGSDDFEELMDTEEAATDAGSSSVADKAKRDRSQIVFPYNDLNSVIEMVRTLHERAGMSCEDVQLASWLNQTASGGGFRSRLSAGRMFGLIETSGVTVSITPLGQDAIDDDRGPASQAEAFLRVPLFRAMYDQFKGYALPPPAAIERQMEALGVAPKQKDRARPTFMKSAISAGYIDAQTGRFTKPAFAAAPPPPVDDAQRDGGNGGGGGGGDEPPSPPITEKALEYRLVDLMADAMSDQEVLQAIIRVITFLKARDATSQPKTTASH